MVQVSPCTTLGGSAIIALLVKTFEDILEVNEDHSPLDAVGVALATRCHFDDEIRGPTRAKRDEGHGSWLTEVEVTKGEYTTDSLKPLDVAGAPLALVNLSEKDVQYRVTKEDVTAKRTPVHVLVVVPKSVADAIAAPSIEKFGEMMAMQFNKVLEDRDRKRPVYSISDLDTEHHERMAKKMRIADKYLVIDEPTPSSTACIPPYSWLDVPEDYDNQRSNYIAYLETHLKAVLDEKRLSLLDVAKKPTVLSIRDPRLPFGMIGTTEVLLVDERSIQHRLPLAGIRMVVKLKKKVEDYHVAQAFGELVAASLIAPDDCTPIGLLTDLDDEWHFSWFNEKKKADTRPHKAPEERV